MADAHIGLLYNAASTLLQTERNRSQSILRSHYLMRCMTITKGYGLPDKHFSLNKRCPHCCTEWRTDTTTKINAIKLSKRQKKRIKACKPTTKNPNPKSILNSKELERTCAFCTHSTVTPILKPEKITIINKKEEKTPTVTPNNTPKQNKSQTKQEQKKAEASIYYNAKEVFSLKNKNNSLVKENKVIKNNKRKKDRFAGLCQQAVLTSVKLKEAKDKNNLLSKFLKTSS